MPITISNRYTGAAIFTAAVSAMSDAVKQALEQEVSLTRANLTGANLTRADLTDARLTGAAIPVISDIHQRLLRAIDTTEYVLDMSLWHACGTTHCRAGMVVMLAGAPGLTLELAIGTNAAAALIYAASDPTLGRVPDWYASNDDAMADIRACAGVPDAA